MTLWSFKGECFKYWILNDHNDTLITRSLIIYADYNVIHYVHQLMYHLCKGFWPSHYKPINRPNLSEFSLNSLLSLPYFSLIILIYNNIYIIKLIYFLI